MIIISTYVMKILDNILDIYPKETTFYFEKGNYELTKQLNITRCGVRFIGLTGDAKDVHIHQKTVGENGINIRSNNIRIEYISVHVEEGEGVCISHSDSDWTTIENCHFYGSDTNFTVYFAGPSLQAGDATINGFLNDNLDMHNEFNNNVIYTKWNGDSISFSLQKFGSIRDNIIHGGKFAIYMVKNCVVTHNAVYNSSAHGIICSLPSHDLFISENFIKNSVSASINIRLQEEHGEYDSENHNIIISNNTICDSKYIGIEVTNANDITINDNRINATEQFGIYILKSSEINVEKNSIVQYQRGVHIDIASNAIQIKNNLLYSVFPKFSEHSIVLEDGVSNCNINGNIVSGPHISSPIKNIGTDNIIEHNNIEEYHSHLDEFIHITRSRK